MAAGEYFDELETMSVSQREIYLNRKLAKLSHTPTIMPRRHEKSLTVPVLNLKTSIARKTWKNYPSPARPA